MSCDQEILKDLKKRYVSIAHNHHKGKLKKSEWISFMMTLISANISMILRENKILESIPTPGRDEEDLDTVILSQCKELNQILYSSDIFFFRIKKIPTSFELHFFQRLFNCIFKIWAFAASGYERIFNTDYNQI